ncbi:MAG: Hpt domain-containing protein [Oscillospiraceae bacterium]|nr:Hpt domain-containing protein [Oscillospiraceae bacterium]
MLTVENLRAWGANVDEALVRCLNNESFYLRLVNKALLDPSFDKLAETVSSGDLEQGFDLAHSLKGVCANLALTPICRPIEQITELLRSRTDTDYTALLEEIGSKRSQLIDLL